MTGPKNYKLIKKIGVRISVLRKVRGFSLEKFSEVSKISIQNLEKYESGEKSMTIDELVMIADILRIGAFQFFL